VVASGVGDVVWLPIWGPPLQPQGVCDAALCLDEGKYVDRVRNTGCTVAKSGEALEATDSEWVGVANRSDAAVTSEGENRSFTCGLRAQGSGLRGGFQNFEFWKVVCLEWLTG
jgi:hypothetical protein